jgi:hypothetical protein
MKDYVLQKYEGFDSATSYTYWVIDMVNKSGSNVNANDVIGHVTKKIEQDWTKLSDQYYQLELAIRHRPVL